MPHEYTGEVTNKFEGLDLANRVPEELWTEARNTLQEATNKAIPEKKQWKKAKWLSAEALQVGEGRKGKVHPPIQSSREQRERQEDLLQWTMQKNRGKHRKGKTRDLFKKAGNIKGTIHPKMGTIKDRNSEDLIEAEEIKKRWKDYKAELHKNGLGDPDNHSGVVSHPGPDTLECEVKWTFGSTGANTASGGDGIPAELFKNPKRWCC